MRKKALVILFAALTAMQITACGAIEVKKPEITVSGPKTSFGVSATVNNQTVGTQTVNTADKGNATYSSDGHTVQATNFSFEIPAGMNVGAASKDKDGVIYNSFSFTTDGKNVVVAAMEGTYKEPISKSNYDDAVNVLLKAGFDTTNYISFSSQTSGAVMVDTVEDGVLYTVINDTLSGLTFIVKTTDNGGYLIVAYMSSSETDENADALNKSLYALGFGKLINWEKSPEVQAQYNGSSVTETTSSQTDTLGADTIGNQTQYYSSNESESTLGNVGSSNTEPTPSIATDTAGLKECVLTLNNKPYTMFLPEAWVQGASDTTISISNPDMNNVSVRYADSYINIGDEEKLTKTLRIMEEASGNEGKIGTVPIPTKSGEHKGYLIIMGYPDWNEYRLYQEVSGYNTYLEIDIMDHDKTYDTDTLIKTFATNV